MNFYGISGTPESPSRRRRKTVSIAYSYRQRHHSLWGNFLFRKPETEGSYVSASSCQCSTARTGFSLAKEAVDVSVRKLRGSLRKLPFESEGLSSELFNYQMESATKWDLRSPEMYNFDEPSKKLPEDKIQNANVVSSLQAELWKAQLRINKLKAEKISSEKKNKRLTGKHRHDKQHDVNPLIDYLQHKLLQEKKERQRAKALNSRLLKRLSDLESFVKRLTREKDVVEAICEELMRKVEALKRKMKRIREDAEEERRMMQMAEAWREERSKMKLVDAKLALQEKYEEMNGLVYEFETFLWLKKDGIGERSMRKAEGLRRMAELVNFSDARELEYSESIPRDDIHSTIEKIQTIEG